jgi:hypothetical protein
MTTSSITSRRSLHLVDLENLVGDPGAKKCEILKTFDHYLKVGRWQSEDHVIIASNPWVMAEIAFDVPVPTNLHAVHGPDRADTMLLALAPPGLVGKRYARLVVGSGDHTFAARAHAVQDLGVHVDVVARHEGCSRRLRGFSCSFIDAADAAVALAA